MRGFERVVGNAEIEVGLARHQEHARLDRLQGSHQVMLVATRDRIKKLFDEGKSEAEVLALDPLKDLSEKWAANNPQLGIAHTRNVYHSFERF